MNWHETDMRGQPSPVVAQLIDLYERQVIAAEKQATALTSIAVTMALQQTAVPVVNGDVADAEAVRWAVRWAERAAHFVQQPYVSPPPRKE